MKPLNNLAEIVSKKFISCKNYLYKNYGENPGKMLVHTGVLGWILSSAAQVAAVVFNDKISSKEKMFLIPQECADAAVNILSFYVITSSFKNLASKLVSTGKLTTKPIKDFLVKQGANTSEHIGKLGFNIENMASFSEIKNEYKPFKNGVDVVASTVGSIISCNIITPVLRNQYAAKKQKEAIAKMHGGDGKNLKSPRGITMDAYIKMSAMKHSSGSLKI